MHVENVENLIHAVAVSAIISVEELAEEFSAVHLQEVELVV